MEYDSASSCDERLRELEAEACGDVPKERSSFHQQSTKTLDSAPWQSIRSIEVLPIQQKVAFDVRNKSLSKQVMEYYQKYSQNTNLDQYFSLPETREETHGVKYYYSIYELNPKSDGDRQGCVGQDYTLGNYVPRERRRWARPPLIGQSSNADASPLYRRPLDRDSSPPPEQKRSATPETIPEERQDSRESMPEISERKTNVSPSSSVASHKPLEWDSGADVGYFNDIARTKRDSKDLSTIERMALAGGCSAALRLDPEGTTESNLSSKVSIAKTGQKKNDKPDANSTPLPGNVSEADSEIEITPILKQHLPGIITGNNVRSEERDSYKERKECYEAASRSNDLEPPTLFKVPSVKYATDGGNKRRPPPNYLSETKEQPAVLKKSSSMNLLNAVSSRLAPKRSQSELNLLGKDKAKVVLPLIFDSTSSLATIVNKPATSDKVIQTTINEHFQESIGVQVSVAEEEKPPVPKRGTSLAPKSIHSILKNNKNTYQVRDSSRRFIDGKNSTRNNDFTDQSDVGINCQSSSEGSALEPSRTPTPRLDDTGNVTGRANSFEYFPGHVYENVPNASGSHVSSVDTRRSNSTTMPNTSSSIDEKLWGDSDSLMRDLERSVNILKNLVDAKKCDKEAKKRLIHHVVKRLVTAKYTDDKIEHDLEENVPWNPDDARRKVYRADIIQALTKKQNTTDSSDDWKPLKKKREGNSVVKKSMERGVVVGEIINSGTSTSDKFDAQTDRTEMDGRKARMGLRTDDCQRSTNSPTDANKSESSECFLPQSSANVRNRSNILCLKANVDAPRRDTSTSDTPTDRNRIYLDPVVDDRRSPVESTNGSANSVDWRVPTTISERKFDLRRRNTSESGDSKLVSYAETEKKNQLLWITNEISHLSNLKKLLEQPKKLVDRPRMSPKKVRQNFAKQRPIALMTCACGRNIVDRARRESTIADGSEALMDRQWSSHCNLASCKSSNIPDDNNLRRLKKRNSCTQTAPDPTRAYSQTGGEIVSAASMYHDPEVKSTFACVQTIEVTTSASTEQQRSLCPVHKEYDSRCKCFVRLAESRSEKLHPRNSAKVVCAYCVPEMRVANVCHRESTVACNDEHPGRSTDSNVRIATNFHRAFDKENCRSELKEAKNKSNATKLTRNCNCNCNMDSSCMESDTIKCKKLLAKVCELCLKKIEQLDANAPCYCDACAKRNSTGENSATQRSQTCGCSGACDCNTKNQPRAMVNHVEISSAKLCKCQNDCDCGRRNVEESCDRHKAYNCPRCSLDAKIEAKAYLHDHMQPRRPDSYEHAKDRYCSNNVNDADRKSWSPRSVESTKGDTSDRSSRTCRGCGSTYKNGRKCSCDVNYPKPIAYELSFGEDKPVLTRNDDVCTNKNQKIRIEELAKKNSAPSSPSSSQKGGSCSCDGTKSNGSRKKTLQDYLAENKPGFLNNAETRQQYMFEISQLRELRKEKRVQLLALASSSNLTKTPRTPKPKACFQRKLSDEEVKERLRQRYYKLHEVRNKRQQREKQEQARRNKLMANIFCKKLQQKVLKGQVDLSNSVSVISNI